MKIRDVENPIVEGVTKNPRLFVRVFVGLCVLAVVLFAVAYCGAAKASEWYGYPNFGGGSNAVSISGAAAVAGGGAGGAGGVGGAGGAASSGPVNVGGDSYSSRAWAIGAPGFANGALTCEAGIPLIGGTYEREGCAILRDAAALHGTLPASAERDGAVKEVLCNQPRIRAAYKTVGKPCASPEPERRW